MLRLTHFKVPTGEQSLSLGEDGLDGRVLVGQWAQQGEEARGGAPLADYTDQGHVHRRMLSNLHEGVVLKMGERKNNKMLTRSIGLTDT